MCYVYEILADDYSVAAYFYNPNIMPAAEHDLRLRELQSYGEKRGFQVIHDEPDTSAWVKYVKEYRYLGEKSPRCWLCYEYRLRKTFERAADLGFDIVATSLSISPHKIAEKINEAGIRLSEEFGIEFLEANFKKKDGFKKSAEMSAELGFYRQDYCGCIYSKLERDRDSRWSRRVAEEKEKLREQETPLFIDFGKEVDLHHFHPRDTKKIVLEFLKNAAEKNFTSVRIIHGKGKSQKKKQVHDILKEHPDVEFFHDDSYNWGATSVRLRIRTEEEQEQGATSPSRQVP